MRLPRTPLFDDERSRFDLRFCCEDCGHFDVTTNLCAHDWPSEVHRRDSVADQQELDFCKEFELC